MALNLQSMLLQPLSPVRGIDAGGFLEAQKLRQLRAQLEEERRRHREDEALRREAEAGERARAALRAQVDREKIEADKAAKLQADKVAAYGKFSESGGKMNDQEMAAQAPFMRALGMGVDYLGAADGLPSYRVTMDEAADQAAEGRLLAQTTTYGAGETAEQSLSRLGAMGYDSLETQDPMTPPEGLGSTEDAYGRALGASEYARENGGAPLRGPDEADYQGGVPRDVIDLGAARSQTLARLDPALGSLIQARPEGYRDSAVQTARAVRQLGLSTADSAKAFTELQKDSDALATGDRSADLDERKHAFSEDKFATEQDLEERKFAFEQGKASREANKPLDEMQSSQLRDRAESRAQKEWEDAGIPNAINARANGQLLINMIDNPDPQMAQVLGPAIMSMAGVKGTQSDRDLLETLGDSRQTITKQVANWIEQKLLDGGFTDAQKAAFREWINERIDSESVRVYDFIDASNKRLREGKEHEEERQGRRNFMLRIPQDVLDDYEVYRHDRGDADDDDAGIDDAPSGATGRGASAPRPIGSVKPASYYQPGQKMPADAPRYENVAPPPIEEDADYQEALANATAETGLDPDAIGRVVGGGAHGHHESGGKPGAKNPLSSASGLIQMTEASANSVGTTAEELRQMTRAEQVPFMVDYFVSRGVTADSPPEDYALAVAAPAFVGRRKDRSAVVYSKGTENHRINRPWWPKDGGDITVGSILDFYGFAPSKRGTAYEFGTAAGKKEWVPKNDAERRLYRALYHRDPDGSPETEE